MSPLIAVILITNNSFESISVEYCEREGPTMCHVLEQVSENGVKLGHSEISYKQLFPRITITEQHTLIFLGHKKSSFLQ